MEDLSMLKATVYWWPLCWEGVGIVRQLDNQNPRVNSGSINYFNAAVAQNGGPQ